MELEIREMSIEDYDEVMCLWQASENVGLHDDVDSRDGVSAFLRRNAGLSFVARSAGRLVGAVLCGHDGRRGYLHHLAVERRSRRRGIGRRLTEHCLARLSSIGIPQCNIHVFAGNEAGAEFWVATGWRLADHVHFWRRSTDPRLDC